MHTNKTPLHHYSSEGIHLVLQKARIASANISGDIWSGSSGTIEDMFRQAVRKFDALDMKEPSENRGYRALFIVTLLCQIYYGFLQGIYSEDEFHSFWLQEEMKNIWSLLTEEARKDIQGYLDQEDQEVLQFILTGGPTHQSISFDTKKKVSGLHTRLDTHRKELR